MRPGQVTIRTLLHHANTATAVVEISCSNRTVGKGTVLLLTGKMEGEPCYTAHCRTVGRSTQNGLTPQAVLRTAGFGATIDATTVYIGSEIHKLEAATAIVRCTS